MRIKDARQTFLGTWIHAVLEGRPFEVWGGAQLRDFNFVEDVVDALLIAAIDPKAVGRVFNLGSEGVISLQDLAQQLVEVNNGGNYTIRTFPSDRKKIDIGDYYADYSLVRDELGWEPRVSLKDGLSRTIEFYRQSISHYVP